jgi:hypothetical protein
VRRFQPRYVPRPGDYRSVDLAPEIVLEMEPWMDVGKELEVEVEMDDEMELEIMTLALC